LAEIEEDKQDLKETMCHPLVADAPLATCILQKSDSSQVKDANSEEIVKNRPNANAQARPKLPIEESHGHADLTTEPPMVRRPTMSSYTYTDPILRPALAASLVADEQVTIASVRELLQEHQRPRRILLHISG
jgi:hypothetical protein